MTEGIYLTNKRNLFAWLALGLVMVGGAIIATWYFTKKSLTSADSPVDSSQVASQKSVSGQTQAITKPSQASVENDAGEVDLVLRAGWNLVGIPYLLSPNDGKTVLLGLEEQEAYYMEQGGWKSLFAGGSITPGSAYWIHSNSGEVVKLTASASLLDDSKPFVIKVKKGWNAVANPFNKEIVWDPVVRAKSGSATLSRAIKAKVISSFYKVDPVGGKYIEVPPGEKIQPFTGMLVRAGGDVDLVISAQ